MAASFPGGVARAPLVVKFIPMIVYQVNLAIAPDTEEEWLSWMRAHHIPDVMDSGYFRTWKLMKLLDGEDPDNLPADAPADWPSFCIEYECDNREQLEAYFMKAAPALQADHTKRYEGRFYARRNILRIQA